MRRLARPIQQIRSDEMPLYDILMENVLTKSCNWVASVNFLDAHLKARDTRIRLFSSTQYGDAVTLYREFDGYRRVSFGMGYFRCD